jgi:hypothetical protein
MFCVPVLVLADDTVDPTDSGLPSSVSPEEAARTGMQVLPEVVTSETAQLLGFESVTDASIARVDLKSPWIVYEISLPGTEISDPDALLQKTNMIFYPITVGGKVASSLTVAFSQKDDTWTTTAWGSPGRIRKLTKHKSSASSIAVQIPQFNLFFVGDHENGQLMLTPIKNTPQFNFIEGAQLSARKVLARLSLAAKTRKPTENGTPQKPG